jgi:hypothetical protein
MNFSFEDLESLKSRTNGIWIDELLQISVAKTVVALEKSAKMQHKNNSKSKVSLLRLIKSNYLLKLEINNLKNCLLKRTLFTNFSIVPRGCRISTKKNNIYLMCFQIGQINAEATQL